MFVFCGFAAPLLASSGGALDPPFLIARWHSTIANAGPARQS
jgi:hypothetical protein